MPSPMIHLAVAHRYWAHEALPPLLGLGSLAPDAINLRIGVTRSDTDAVHFRTADRAASLAALKATLQPGDPFAEGCLLHLYADMIWDEEQISRFREVDGKGDWFSRYREEIYRTSFYLYHHMSWARDLMDKILSTAIPPYPFGNGPTTDEIDAFCQRFLTLHDGGPPEPPRFYTSEAIDSYIESTATSYRQWRAE